MNPADPTLARDAVLRRNNVVIAGRDRGKPPLVFVNGFGCEQGMWRSVAPHFAPGRQVVLFDHVGTGPARGAPFDAGRYASLQAYADDLLDVCDAADIPDAVLVAHSTGAMIGVLAAIRRPAAFRQFVLIAPSPCYLNDASYLGGFEHDDLQALFDAIDVNYGHWAHQLAPLIMGNPERPELAWELESSMNRMDVEVARQFARVSFGCDHRADLALLDTPTVVLQSAEDNMVPEVVAEFIRDTIPGCGLIRLEATGHCPQLSAPQEVTRMLRTVLDHGWSETQPAELSANL
ncbi:MAG: alpha/beta hydrolase [Pseudomonadota bacterium]|nr:alpha/beta hydrolase [Pseudomonadota bacterium]